MSQAERSKLALLSIILTIIGIVLAAYVSDRIGLTFIFFAALLMAGSFVSNRLKKIGAEAWAIGSIMVWIGYFFFSLPILGLVWEIFPKFRDRLFLFIIGIILITLGFSTEYYDLNVKFLKFWKRTKKRFIEIIELIKAKFFRSIWTLLATITIIYFIFSFVFHELLQPISGIDSNQNYQRLILLSIALVFLLIEFRTLILLGLASFLQISAIFINGLIRRLTHIPSLLKQLINLVKEGIYWLWELVNSSLIFIIYNTYLFAFAGAILVGIYSFYAEDEILYGIALILVIIAFMMLLVQKPTQIADRISRVQQYAYQRSTIARNFVKRVESNECPNCGAWVEKNYTQCYSCNNPIPKCSVCKGAIFTGSEIISCNHCEQSGHRDHLQRWIQIKPICPHCRKNWSPKLI